MSSHMAEIDDPYMVRLSAFVIVLITILVYQPIWRAGFVWDDDVLIVDNPMVKASDGLYQFWFTTEAPDYWPMTQSIWWLEWRLWSNRSGGYHIANVLLHGANALLVWMILRHLKIPGAWLAAMVFAVHPVNVATVAWVSEQKNTLSMLFYTAAVLLFLKFDENDRWCWYGFSFGAFLLALLSKTAVVMLPVVLLACIWWKRGRVGRQDILRIGPFLALSLTFGFVSMWFHNNRALVLGGLTNQTGNLLSRIAGAGWALSFYLYKTFLPWNLCAIYPKWNVDSSCWLSYIPGLFLLGLLVLCWWKQRTWGRPLVFGLGYFVVTLVPVLGFFYVSFFAYSWVADQWQYAAIAGPIALVVSTGVSISHRMGEWGKSIGVLASVAVIVALGGATWARSSIYENSETLWQDTVAKNPNAWVAHYNLGNSLMQSGRIKDAIEQYDQAIRNEPDHQEVHNNLALAYLNVGNIAAAITHLERVVRINPGSAMGHCNLGNAYWRAGRKQDAIRHYEDAVRLNPSYVQAHVNLGFALAQRGRFKEAAWHWECALRLDPNNRDAARGLERVQHIKSSSENVP